MTEPTPTAERRNEKRIRAIRQLTSTGKLAWGAINEQGRADFEWLAQELSDLGYAARISGDGYILDAHHTAKG